MPTDRIASRRVLMLMHMGLSIPSAMVAGLQYRALFAGRPGYEVFFESLTVPSPGWVDRASPLLRRLRLHRLVDWLQAWRLRRHRQDLLALASTCDVVVAIKIPDIEFHRALVGLARPRVLFWLGDALWLPAFRSWGWEHLDEIVATSHGIICECDYLLRYVRKFNQRTFRVDDAPQVEDFDRWRGQVLRNPEKVVLGWVGSQANACALFGIFEPLERLFAKYPHLELRIVGGDPASFPRFEQVRWSSLAAYDQETMIREVLAMDIGLFPLFDVEESLARGTLKAMIYMSGEVAAVCQNLGSNPELVRDGINGMLAGTHREWTEKLEWLIEHPEERRRIAKQGLQTVRERFSRARCFEQLVYAIEHA